MSKKSSVEKNNRRKRLVKQYKGKRERLLGIANDESKTMEERFEARLRLAEVPRNGNPTRIRNRCEMTGRPRAYYRKLGMSRIALRELGSSGQIPGLVKSSWEGEGPMSMNTPIGDMIARIRNAAERKRSKVATPASKMRGRVLDVLQDEGYI